MSSADPLTELRAWHGTTAVRAARILREGLVAGSYLAESVDMARYYATEAVEAAQTAGVDESIIEVLAPTVALLYDPNAMNEPVMTGDVRRDMAWHQAAGDHPDWMVDGYIHVPAEAWVISWRGVGSVRTGMTVIPKRLRRLAVR